MAGVEGWRIRCRHAAVALALSVLASQAANAQVGTENYERDRRLATEPFAETAPDTTGFWFYLRRNELSRAREELQRLQDLAPGWSPPAAMREALEPSPAAEATAPEPDAAELARRAQDARMERLAALPADAYNTIDAAVLARARSEAERLRRGDHLLLLAWVAIGRGALDEADALLERAESLDAGLETADARKRIVQARVEAAISERDGASLASYLQGGDGDLARSTLNDAAWSAFDGGDAGTALWRFRRLPRSPDSALGEALALRSLGRHDAAIAAACDEMLRVQDASLCRDWLAERQARLYAALDFEASATLGQRLAQLGLATADSRELLAWSLLELGQTGAAAAQFEAMLVDSPQREDVADALLRSTGEDAAREALAKRFVAVRTALARQQSVEAFARKQFDRVAREGVEGRGGLELSAGLDWRRREGGTGLSTVERREGSLDATALWGDWRWRLRWNDSDYDMPAVEAGSWFGSAPVGDAFPGLRRVADEGLRLELSREFDGMNLYAGVARDLIDQPANESFTGQLSASFFGDRSTTAFTAYHRFREDTLLSRVGNVDTRAPTPFGGAISTGLRGLHARSLGGDWSAAISGHVEVIGGEKVADNEAWQLRTDLAYDHAGAGLDYWRTGPYLSWWHFEENLSDYSFGHGGYFSPDAFASVGLSSELLTLEGARWQVKGAVSLGWSRIEQSAYSRFPLLASGPRVPGRNDTGLSGEVTLQAQYRLSPRWRVSGYLYHLEAIEFEATSAGLTLHFTPGGRRGVVSRDLPLEAPWLKGFAL